MNNELYHYGVKGMRWGVRRYQNTDGTLTAAGRKRYVNQTTGEITKKGQKAISKSGSGSSLEKHIRRESMNVSFSKNWWKTYNKASDEFNSKIGDLNNKFGENAHTGNKKYVKATGKLWKDCYSRALIKDFGADPVSGTKDWIQDAPFMNMYEDYIED